MNTRSRRCIRRTERGGVAVEMAFVLPLMIMFLAIPLFAARMFWYYSVAEKAAHDAARFLSTATQQEMMDQSASPFTPVAQLATSIAEAELDEIKPALNAKFISVTCDSIYCSGQGSPQWVRATVQIRVHDGIFGVITDEYFGEDGLFLKADVTMRYVGN